MNPLFKESAWSFTPVVKEAPVALDGAVDEIFSLFVPSKVQCASKLAAATSSEVLYPLIGGNEGVLLLEQAPNARIPAAATEQIKNLLFTRFMILNFGFN